MQNVKSNKDGVPVLILNIHFQTRRHSLLVEAVELSKRGVRGLNGRVVLASDWQKSEWREYV